MAAQGAALQNHNNELVRCIEDLREKRTEIDRQVQEDEQEKQKISNDIKVRVILSQDAGLLLKMWLF